jgi:hypothetical protein
MAAEKNKWMSESRKAVLADEAERLKEYERVQIEEARIKSEQLRAVRIRKWSCWVLTFFCSFQNDFVINWGCYKRNVLGLTPSPSCMSYL